MPPVARRIQLGNLAEPPDCWYWWELAGLDRKRIIAALAPGSVRYGTETQELACSMLDTILDRASSAAIQSVLDFLSERAVKWIELRDGLTPTPSKKSSRRIR